MDKQFQFSSTGPSELKPLEVLGISQVPQAEFRQYSESVELGDHTFRPQGFPVVIWRFDDLSDDEQLVFVTASKNPDAKIAIRTKLPDEMWGTFTCELRIPSGSTIEFIRCFSISEE